MKNRVRSIASRIVIDCSGDADVAVAAGANFRSGQEGTGKTQPISMLLRCFGTDNEKVAATMGEGVIARATKADHPTPFPVYFRGSLSKWNEQVLRDKLVHNRDHMVFFNTVWPNQLNVNTTAVFGVDGTDPIALSRATVQLTDQAARIGEFLKRNVDGFQGVHYVPAIFAGVRETRNIIGHYQITGDDVLEGRKFEDSIGEACFPVDIHDPDTGQASFIEIGGDGSFGIPFRSLIPAGLNNTLVAGRCLSADPIASASTRNMGACMVTGEAAGVAAAIAVDRNADFARLDVADIQKEVLRRGGFINGRSGAKGRITTMSAATTELGTFDRLFIGGEFVAPVDGAKIHSINPATGAVWTDVASATAEDIDRAVAAADRAFRSGPWRKMTGGERGRLMDEFARRVVADVDRLATIESTDNGKPITLCRGDVANVGVWLRYFAGLADKIHGERMPLSADDWAYTIPEPLGVVGAIVAWNSPLLLAAWKLGPALAAGNTVVLKPSELAPASSLRLAELAREAGLPPGVINVVPGFGPTAGEALVNHPSVAKLSFTGSDATGRRVAEAAGRGMKSVTLECGGKAPLIVFEDADIDEAAAKAVGGMFVNAGQQCTVASRVFVQSQIL